jgi:glycosyltransferase involved in cell wall biosynthesis
MLTSVIIARNEEKNISRCLKSVSWSNEIILVDDYSTDNTTKIAKKYNAKIYKRHLNNDFSAQRNFGLSKSKGDWILFVDADEVVTKSLEKEIKKEIKKENKFNGFYVKRVDYFLGKKIHHGEMGKLIFLRLAKKGTGKWTRKVHEQWKIKGRKKILTNPLLHYPEKTIHQFIDKINYYSNIHSAENKNENKRVNVFKIITYPLAKFIKNYFFRLGFLDREEGLILAVLMSFHSFLSWSKQWTREN